MNDEDDTEELEEPEGLEEVDWDFCVSVPSKTVGVIEGQFIPFIAPLTWRQFFFGDW